MNPIKKYWRKVTERESPEDRQLRLSIHLDIRGKYRKRLMELTDELIKERAAVKALQEEMNNLKKRL